MVNLGKTNGTVDYFCFLFSFTTHSTLAIRLTQHFLFLRGGGDCLSMFHRSSWGIFSNSGPDAGCNWRGTTSGASNVLVQMGRRKDDPCKPGGSQLKEPISSVMKKPVEPSYP